MERTRTHSHEHEWEERRNERHPAAAEQPHEEQHAWASALGNTATQRLLTTDAPLRALTPAVSSSGLHRLQRQAADEELEEETAAEAAAQAPAEGEAPPPAATEEEELPEELPE